MKSILSVIGTILLFAACSRNGDNTGEIKTLQNKCTEYEAQIEQLQSENHRLQTERDSLNAVLENVRNWLYNN